MNDSDTRISPWLTVQEAAQRARCGPRVIYRKVQAGRLRSARVGGRRELRLLADWIDDWLLASAPVEVDRSATLIRPS
jgi:excisionase family DNA binding protein